MFSKFSDTDTTPTSDFDKIIEIIRDIKRKQPQLRLFQIIYDIQSIYSRENINYGRVLSNELTGYDFFSLEDEKFLKSILNILNSDDSNTHVKGIGKMNIGDIVQLRSGGPAMTIRFVYNTNACDTLSPS